MTKNKIFYYFTIIFGSLIISLFHFIRLSLGWDIVINQSWSLPTTFSGFAIIFAIFISYWSWILIKNDKNNKTDKEENDQIF